MSKKLFGDPLCLRKPMQRLGRKDNPVATVENSYLSERKRKSNYQILIKISSICPKQLGCEYKTVNLLFLNAPNVLKQHHALN